MAEAPDKDQKTEEATPKRKQDAIKKGDVLQSRELGTALVMLAGAAWIALAGGWIVGGLETMLKDSLSFGIADIRDFDPAALVLRLLGHVGLPLFALFGVTLLAAIGTPAVLGSLGFRWGAIQPKGDKLNPLNGLKRIFGVQGLVELGKSLAKIVVLGAVGLWLLMDSADQLMTLGNNEIRAALAEVGQIFIVSILVLAGALVLIAGVDIPAQIFQRGGRLRMTKQEVKDEHKQTEGSPELKAAIRRKQHEVLRGSARTAVAEATVVLANPTHFAVALRYRPGLDAAPIVVARGRGATALAIRELAGESGVPVLTYPQLARAVYFTAQTGQVIREDLYIAVATIIAFVFNLDAAVAAGQAPPVQPEIEVPDDARYDEDGRKE